MNNDKTKNLMEDVRFNTNKNKNNLGYDHWNSVYEMVKKVYDAEQEYYEKVRNGELLD
jgi:hypothetical protein